MGPCTFKVPQIRATELSEESSDYRHCEEPTGPAFGGPDDKLRDESNPDFRCGFGLLRGACHRARVRATRWLAMTVNNQLALALYASVLRRHGNNAAGKSAAERRSRGGRGGIGRGLGSGAMTLR